MKLTARLKKRLLLLFFIPMFLLAAALGVFWFFIHYRFKDSIKYLVARESKGRFAFDASDASFSFWKGTIIVKGGALSCRDTTGIDLWCNMNTPELYFSLASWRSLLFDKKLIIDSLAIIGPSIDIHVRNTRVRQPHSEFHAADFMDFMKNTLLHLNVHAFALKGASFSYQGPAGSEPLHGDHIDLVVSNFARFNNGDSHLLGSDHLSLSLGRQHWAIPAARQLIDFAQLTFDSRGQRFELDSFFFRQQIARGELRLQADRFFFNSSHFPAIYQQDQLLRLLLDTLVCVNPVLSIPEDPRQPGAKDSISKTIHENLFGRIDVSFVDVIDGHIHVQKKNGLADNAYTRKANLRIYNLQIDPARAAPLSTDSIRMNLKNIEFLTRDSLYALSIGEFALSGKDALFSQVQYRPTRPDPDKEVVFTAPSLSLKNISLPDLLRKHLRASGAELLRPRIMMADNKKEDTVDTRRRMAADAKKIALFYRTLHNIRELIDAPDFIMIDGSARYTHTGRTPTTVDISGLNAHILLNKFFISDSLVDIKHAIPLWRIANLDLITRGLHLRVEQYGFNGAARYSGAERFGVTTDNGWQLEGQHIFWDVLDWDRYQKTREIRLDSLHIGSLVLHAPALPVPRANTAPLPSIHVDVLDITTLAFNKPSESGGLQFTADRLHVAGIRSAGHAFAWDNATATFHDISIKTRQTRVTTQQIDFDSEKGADAKNTVLEIPGKVDSTRLVLPRITIGAILHSSDPSLLAISSLASTDAMFAYAKANLHLTAQLTLNAGPITFHPLRFTGVDLSWKETTLKYSTDSTALSITRLSGSFHDPAFAVPAKGFDWRPWLTRITISHAAIQYSAKNITADAGNLSWTGNTLRIADFHVLPKATREEAFKKARWQNDYITLKGNMVTLSGLRLPGDQKHISPEIGKITLDRVSVEASRDKHIPFRHGIEKLMPGKLISKLPLSIRVDTVFLVNDDVLYNELSVATDRWSSIPITGINGYLRHLRSRDNGKDTLTVDAYGRLFDGHIRRFSYAESYGDSLSAFTAKSAFSSLDLTRLSVVSIPAAAVSIAGHVDTIWSVWKGNRYAAYGTMNLYYDQLRVKVLNKKDSTHRGFVPALETWAARLILPGRNKKTSVIFFERDREKFVFNYWVKTEGSGILSTLIRKKNDQYRKLYAQKSRQYSLPPE